jgi:hypothetical protein
MSTVARKRLGGPLASQTSWECTLRIADCRLNSDGGLDGPTREAPVRERRGFFYL